MIYILVNTETGRRVKWWPDPMRVEALETLKQWDRWSHGVYRLDTAQNDDMVNDYPQGEIPDAMGGSPVALMDDGGTLCEFCVADPFNPVRDARHHDLLADSDRDGWGVIAWFNSAESEGLLVCDHCNTVLHEGGDE
jgi:hypothetical protein